MEKYSLDLINKNLKFFYERELKRKNSFAEINLKGEPFKIPVSLNYVYPEGVEKLAYEISKITKEKKEEIYRKLTTKPDFNQLRIRNRKNLEKRLLINLGLSFVTLILVFLIGINSKLTGNVIQNPQLNSITNIGIIFSVFLLLAILLYRIKSIAKTKS